jgi:hypothetical protein
MARLRQTRHDISNLQRGKNRQIADQRRDGVRYESRKADCVDGQEQCGMDMGVCPCGGSRKNVDRRSSKGSK